MIASYNVHRCIGSDGVHDPDRVAAVLGELQADVIGLQEVVSGPESEGGVDEVSYLARAGGFGWVRGPTMRGPAGRYGNALLTRLRVLDARLHDLSQQDREPRGAIDVVLAHERMRLRVVATHLGLLAPERSAQCQRLLEHLAAWHAVDVSVLLGDFNDWWTPAHGLDALHAHFGATPALRSFPAKAPLLPLDRIWVKPSSAVLQLRAHRSPLARRASDHLPVRAVVDVSPWLGGA